ncbi:MAG: hypothetical protein ACFBRM_03675 [Pikeienuella sp.]
MGDFTPLHDRVLVQRITDDAGKSADLIPTGVFGVTDDSGSGAAVPHPSALTGVCDSCVLLVLDCGG